MPRILLPIDCDYCLTRHRIEDGHDPVMVAFLQPARDDVMAEALAEIARDAPQIRAAAARVRPGSTYLGAMGREDWTHT